MPPLLILVLVITIGGLAVASMAPAAANWVRAPGDEVVDLDVHEEITWHVFGSYWSLSNPDVTIEPSKLINVKAWFVNLLSLGFGSSQTVEFRLEDSKGGLLQTQHEATGPATPLTDTRTLHVAFREVPPGTYRIHLVVLDDEGGRVSEASYPLRLASTS